MSKKKIGVIFGGTSTEHEVSVVSATSVIEQLDKERYDIQPIYIAKDGTWYHYIKEINQIQVATIGEKITEIEHISDIITEIKKQDVIFPVLHGLGGEDGSIQGLLEIAQVPYVGCGILASSIGMDKVYTKAIFEQAKIQQVKYEHIKKVKNQYIYIDKEFNETKSSLKEIIEKVEAKLTYPMFVKPSNSGSSVGVKKATNKQELQENIEHASQFDNKILIEEGIQAREIECAVLGKKEVISSCVGEIKPAEEFYSFDAKYKNAESKVEIPADIDKQISNQIRDLAIKAFKAIDGSGLARVDFFVEHKTNKIYINEINTLPGFTKISMYPKLFEQVGMSYKELLDKLIQLAEE